MLAKWGNRYYTALGIERSKSASSMDGACFLRCPDRAGEEERGFAAIQMGPRVMRQRRFESLAGITFYKIKYKGYIAVVRGWPIASNGEILLIDVVRGWEERLGELDYGSPAYRRVGAELAPLGFREIPHDGGYRSEVRIDDLEKIEVSAAQLLR